MLHLARGVHALPVRSDCPPTRPYKGGRPSSHKANLIAQNKRQDTIVMMIPCLCSFLLTVPSSPSAELPINKKRTRTLFRKESGSSTNCMVEVRRIELLSEKATAELSPSAVRVLTFPLPSAHERAQGFSSFIMCSCCKA